jgi:hypothetical protein
VTSYVAATEVVETDLLERPVADAPAIPVVEDRFSVELRPFQIRTLLLRLGRGSQPLTSSERTCGCPYLLTPPRRWPPARPLSGRWKTG